MYNLEKNCIEFLVFFDVSNNRHCYNIKLLKLCCGGGYTYKFMLKNNINQNWAVLLKMLRLCVRNQFHRECVNYTNLKFFICCLTYLLQKHILL